jgi:multidrug efflux pump subunit AcrA (membrane-fusion protein)
VTGAVSDEVRLTGTIMPLRATQVSAEVASTVAEVLVDEGTPVDVGQPLLRLRSAQVEIDVKEAEARLSLAKALLNELLNGTRVEDVDIKRAIVQEMEADLNLRKAEYDRVAELLTGEAVSRSEFDSASAMLQQSQAKLARERAELALAIEGPRAERIEAARAEVLAAEARLEKLTDDLERHTVRAPFHGVIGTKFTEVGQWVRVGDPLFTLAELDILRAEVEIPERYFNRINVGSVAALTIDALVGKEIEAPVSVKIPVGNVSSRAFPVKIDIQNKEYRIAPGMLVRVVFSLPDLEGRESLLAPKDAVVMTPDQKRALWVVVDSPEGKIAERRDVNVGRSFGKWTEILAPTSLTVGDKVVVRGNETLRPGQAVALTLNQGTEPVPSPADSALAATKE